MPETFAPRPYQAQAIEALVTGWKGAHNRLAVVLPTGAGKTVVFANLIRAVFDSLNGHRALVIAHREELIHQAVTKIKAVCPELRVGIVKAERDEHQDVDVIVASVQTLSVARRREAIRDIGLVIVDECHHYAAPSYMEVLEHFGAWRGVPVAGFTATMTRADGGLADVWQEVVFTLDILDMIGAGYLVDVRGKRVIVDGLDLDAVKTSRGDLQDGQLGQALEDSGAARVIADAYKELAGDRPGVVFTPTVATAHAMADAFTATGIPAATVWGDMPKADRINTLARYQAGDLQVLANCMVLTEGFDAPWTSCAVIARPTKSPGLYCQMAGRALRLHPGKTDALLLDVMGASTRHKLASIVDLTSRDIAAPDDEQTLREAVAEQDEAEKRSLALKALEWEEFNLFNDSPVRWLRTYQGVWFIPAHDDRCPDRLLFLLHDQAAGGYRIRMWENGATQAPPNDNVFDLKRAMFWAEHKARQVAPGHFVNRSAAWRSKPASSRQLGYCRFNRIIVPSGSTAGDVSDLQAVHTASSRLDRQAVAAA
jgi:superfamily II DNA or RNA helicase